MTVERNTPVTSGKLTITGEPGVALTQTLGNGSFNLSVDVTVAGALGVRFLSTLIEEATALRDELRAVVG